MVRTSEMVEINLSGSRGGDVVEADEEVAVARRQPHTEWPADTGSAEEPQLRFFAVGPSSYQIRCPLCRHTADTETVHMIGPIGDLACVLAVLSCCFPIFWLSCVYCTLQGRLKTKRLFCNKCGGHLGFYRRPT